jgi:FkbM family methyltransferase
MADVNTWRSHIQVALIKLYSRLQSSHVMQSEMGQCLFEHAYSVYKILLEAGPVERLRSYVLPRSLVIDVGANIGFFTLRFARWLRDDGRVIAIEPEIKNFMALKRRLSKAGLDNRVVVLQAVAAEKNGMLNLEINPHHPADHKIGETGMPTTAITLDGLLAGQTISRYLLSRSTFRARRCAFCRARQLFSSATGRHYFSKSTIMRCASRAPAQMRSWLSSQNSTTDRSDCVALVSLPPSIIKRLQPAQATTIYSFSRRERLPSPPVSFGQCAHKLQLPLTRSSAHSTLRTANGLPIGPSS